MSASPPPATPPLGFDGAALGMTVGAWRALSPPPGVGPSAMADCGPGIVAALRTQQIPTAPPAVDQTICAYDVRFGGTVLLHSAKLDQRYRIDGLRYRFTDGRLSEINFTASIDAYSDIVAEMSRDYGPPTATVRDTVRTQFGRLDRVRQTWRTHGGVVSLIDPANDPLWLGVRIASVPTGR